MKRRVILFLGLILTAFLAFAWQYGAFSSRSSIILPTSAKPRACLLLIPLDSRPPCREFVRDAAALVDYAIILPPSELMDYYSAPGDTKGMQSWLAQKLKQADVAIISIDQLLSGGLLASREGYAKEEKIPALLNYLRQLHLSNPTVKLQAFSILPRLLPPDSIDGAEERKALLNYSQLVDKAAVQQFTTYEELQELQELRSSISTEALQHYEALFRNHLTLAQGLLKLVQEGVLDRMIIGRDDSGKYGLPNLEARQLEAAMTKMGLPAERAAITHGADELALTMLAAEAAKAAQLKPRVHLAYSDVSTPQRLMPYMGGSLQATAKEKIALLGGAEATTAEDADFTLFISAIGRDNLDMRLPAALRLKEALQKGEQLALVDLSEHFTLEETLLPQMINNRVPLQQLTAYAGWNTASNAIGTAMSQAVLLQAGRKLATDNQARARLAVTKLTLLNQRFLEDSFYLKDIIDSVNYNLRKSGYFDVNDLDMEHNYLWANAMLQHSLAERRRRFELLPAFRLPYKDEQTGQEFFVHRLQEEVYFPWPRTFEINLKVKPQINIINH